MSPERTSPSFLAFDLGAESGRAVLGSLAGQRLELQEIHRFPNGPVRVGDSLLWDILRLWSEMQHGLALASHQAGGSLASLGVDSWGVDFGLLAANDELLGNPYHYRDHRTDGMLEATFALVTKEEIYQQTGIQFMQLNSLYQLLSMVRAGSPILDAARTFLNIPDLFNFWLCGVKASEFTIASTSQCYNLSAGEWAYPLLEKLGIPASIFGRVVQPTTVLGRLRPVLASQAQTGRVPVIATSGHDTASAVAAVPANSPDTIYLSSGTWSLMGVEIHRPVINAASLAFNVTNEGGVNGTIRFLKNIMGLWLLQECRREWSLQGNTYSYDELTQMASKVPGFRCWVYPSDPRFIHPSDSQSGTMSARIQSFCRETRQDVPETHGEIVRCILESLAMEYRRTADGLAELLKKELPVIHIIGGGSRNRLLNQFAANATGRPVVAGPAEATAIGNILVQAIATGDISSLEEGRAMLRRSVEINTYEPTEQTAWDDAFACFLDLGTESE